MCPLVKELQKHADMFNTIVCVTGQHREMLDQVLKIFNVEPDYDLNIMKQGQDLYDVTARVLTGMRDVFKECKPDVILVHGDTTTSMAAALAAFYQQIPVGHVEAGLRTHNIYSPWPEEMNRQITGRIAEYNFAPTPLSAKNLQEEKAHGNIYVTGNTVIDALHMVVGKLRTDTALSKEQDEILLQAGYDVTRLQANKRLVLITGHRRENFGDGFIRMVTAMKDLSEKYPNVDFVYPMHLNPNVRKPVMGLSFLGLLYLQVSYIEAMVKMRKEQFDNSVRNSLYQVSKDVEFAETDRWLREDISEAERKALTASSTIQGEDLVQQTQRFTVKSPDGRIMTDFELKVMTNKPSELPKMMISRRHGGNTIPKTSKSLLDAVKNRYMYQRVLLDEVALQMVYRASDKSIGERVRFKDLDDYLKSALLNNGIELPYHFTVIDKDGREVYRCADFEMKGSEDSYTQPLFQNDPPAKMSIVKVHFPGKKDYIFDSVSFMIPSMIFTFVLLITFIFTLYIVFRQKKLTEMKNDFINNMTHEFKTPISTISLAAQMLKDPAVS